VCCSSLILASTYGTNVLRSAIGHSTNLIGREANIIIIRGGGELATDIYTQMRSAMREYFPSNNIENDPEVNPEVVAHDTENNELRRINTGVTSLVGSQNGQRPGGFVLVIDGLALADVGPSRHPFSHTRLY
jgi:hypothetical protein